MAARRTHTYRYLGGAEPPSPQADQFELDEADLWTSNDVVVLPETKLQAYHNPRPARKPLWKRPTHVDHFPACPRSLPMNIPEWSKMLGGGGGEEEEEDDMGNDRIPPHEYLARARGASLSVHEGAGRTLKGRDLSRVRNAIWKQIGFED